MRGNRRDTFGLGTVILTLMALLFVSCGQPAETGPAQIGGASTGAAADPSPADSSTSGSTPAGAAAGAGREQNFGIDLSGTKIKMSTSKPGPIVMTAYYMADKLREYGADVEIVNITGLSGVQTVIAGQVDMASQGTDELILGNAQNAKMLAVGGARSKMDYVLVGKKQYNSVTDLKGRPVGMSGPSGFDTLLTRYAFREAGLNPRSDVRFVQIGGSPDRASALLSGNIEAATIFIDDWAALEKRTDDLHAIQYMSEIVPKFVKDVYFSKRSFWEENPELALGVACANLEANRWFKTDREGWVNYVLKNVPGAEREVANELYDTLSELEMYPTDPKQILSPEGVEGLIGAMAETGDIEKSVAAKLKGKDMVDTSYLEEAKSRGCGGE